MLCRTIAAVAGSLCVIVLEIARPFALQRARCLERKAGHNSLAQDPDLLVAAETGPGRDEISDDAKAVGDIFFGILTGGVFGVLSAVGNAILKQQTEKDLSEHVVAFFDDEDDEFGIINNALAEKDDNRKQSEQQQTVSQNDDYWSIRMKQIFGDDDYG